MLRVILVVVIITVSFFLIGCSDLTEISSASEDMAITTDTTASIDVAVSGDVVAGDIMQDDIMSGDVIAVEDVGVVVDAVDSHIEADVSESLPSDPTENPEGSESESAHYSFPVWEVPPSSDDNR